MRMPTAAREEVEGLLHRSMGGLLVCALSGVFLAAIGNSAIALGASTLFFSGVCLAALLALSWRHYHPHLSWLIWAAPGPALVAAAFSALVVPAVRTGVVSIPVALLAVGACVGGGFFGTLVIFGKRIKQWLAT